MAINEILKKYKISIGIFYRIKEKRGLPNREKRLVHK